MEPDNAAWTFAQTAVMAQTAIKAIGERLKDRNDEYAQSDFNQDYEIFAKLHDDARAAVKRRKVGGKALVLRELDLGSKELEENPCQTFNSMKAAREWLLTLDFEWFSAPAGAPGSNTVMSRAT